VVKATGMSPFCPGAHNPTPSALEPGLIRAYSCVCNPLSVKTEVASSSIVRFHRDSPIRSVSRPRWRPAPVADCRTWPRERLERDARSLTGRAPTARRSATSGAAPSGIGLWNPAPSSGASGLCTIAIPTAPWIRAVARPSQRPISMSRAVTAEPGSQRVMVRKRTKTDFRRSEALEDIVRGPPLWS